MIERIFRSCKMMRFVSVIQRRIRQLLRLQFLLYKKDTDILITDRPEWLTADLIEIMKDRDRAMKLACKSKLTSDKKNARVLRNHVNKAVKAAKSEYLLTKLDTYKKDPKKFWQAINDILPHSKSHTPKSIIGSTQTINQSIQCTYCQINY